MGVVATSCCHRRAELSFADKVANTIIGYMLPLSTIGQHGSDHDENFRGLEYCRAKAQTLTNGAYERAVRKGGWKVEEKQISSVSGNGTPVSVLIHTPTLASADIELPLIIWAHGGGLTINDYKDNYGADLMNDIVASHGSQFVWVSVNYRLAPEAKFPAPVEDVVCVYEALLSPSMASTYGYSTSKVGLAGASAGAFLVGHAAISLAKRNRKIAFAAMLYPMVDPRMQSEAHQIYGDLPACPGTWLAWSWSASLAEDGAEPSEVRMREANLLEKDFTVANGLQALVMTGTCDCLHDEAKAFSDCMVSAGLGVLYIESFGAHCSAHFSDTASKDKMLSWWRDVLGS